jgi:hypothetical protein
MSLAGAALRFIESDIADAGVPGGKVTATIIAQPTGSYPALGEPIATLLAALWALPSSQPKVPTGVKPSVAWVNDNLGHTWSYDRNQGTMGALRCWTTSGATPTEHATGVYGGNEATAILTIEMEFPLYGSMTR